MALLSVCLSVTIVKKKNEKKKKKKKKKKNNKNKKNKKISTQTARSVARELLSFAVLRAATLSFFAKTTRVLIALDCI